MNKSRIFKLAHKRARKTAEYVGNYSIALSLALKSLHRKNRLKECFFNPSLYCLDNQSELAKAVNISTVKEFTHTKSSEIFKLVPVRWGDINHHLEENYLKRVCGSWLKKQAFSKGLEAVSAFSRLAHQEDNSAFQVGYLAQCVFNGKMHSEDAASEIAQKRTDYYKTRIVENLLVAHKCISTKELSCLESVCEEIRVLISKIEDLNLNSIKQEIENYYA